MMTRRVDGLGRRRLVAVWFAVLCCHAASLAHALSVSVAMNQSPATPGTGSAITYQIVVVNTGTETVLNFEITDTIPSVLTDVELRPFRAVSNDVDWLPDSTATYRHWRSGLGLNPGASMTFTITGTVVHPGSSGSFTN